MNPDSGSFRCDLGRARMQMTMVGLGVCAVLALLATGATCGLWGLGICGVDNRSSVGFLLLIVSGFAIGVVANQVRWHFRGGFAIERHGLVLLPRGRPSHLLPWSDIAGLGIVTVAPARLAGPFTPMDVWALEIFVAPEQSRRHDPGLAPYPYVVAPAPHPELPAERYRVVLPRWTFLAGQVERAVAQRHPESWIGRHVVEDA